MKINELREYIINTYGYSPEEVTIISGIMGVPISFMDKYSPEQFEIVGWSRHNEYNMDGGYWLGGKNDATINGKDVYRRIFIRHKR